MAAISLRRVALGTLAGGVVWGIWSTIINMVILMPKYAVRASEPLSCYPSRATRSLSSTGLLRCSC